jgi:hypothetical protein
MDQTYLLDLLHISPLKDQETGGLKSFTNRILGRVTLSQSKYAQKFQSRTTLMAIEAKLPLNLREKWSKKRKMVGVEIDILDLNDWLTYVS